MVGAAFRRRHAEAGGHLPADAGFGDLTAQFFGDRGGRLQRGPRQEEAELFAAVSSHEVRFRTPSVSAADNVLKDFVARRVAMHVVDQLEMVDVDHDATEERPLAEAVCHSTTKASNSDRRLRQPVRGSRAARTFNSMFFCRTSSNEVFNACSISSSC